jgi:hypothetical protein
MDRNKIIALVLIGVFVVILLQNVGMTDGVTIKLLVSKVHASLSAVLLGTMALGVTVGILLK